MPTWNKNKCAWVSLEEYTQYQIEVVTLPTLRVDFWNRVPPAKFNNPSRVQPKAVGVETRHVDGFFEVRSRVALTDLKIEVHY